MIKSMTGYGRGEYIEEDRQAIVEISAVNNRYFDTNIRMPRSIMFFEEDVRKYVKNLVARGKLDIYITYSSQAKEDISIKVNEALCEEYVNTLRAVKNQFNLLDDISTMQITSLPDIIVIEKNETDKEQVWGIVSKALEAAVTSFNTMRQKEGEMLKEDLISKGQTIFRIIDEVNARSPLVVDRYKQKLYQRIVETLGNLDVEPDPGRILTEVAIFSDRSSVDEEITRLRSHISQLNDILDEGGVVGRKLDFLLQEINREGNTIGSKSTDELITKLVIELKSEIEKIREQVQNIE
ncbi:MAG TPA: YicC family protein [Epulopiscium sp.]|nr:YicC family protein [Candidatus Epulonipiscium sp.]